MLARPDYFLITFLAGLLICVIGMLLYIYSSLYALTKELIILQEWYRTQGQILTEKIEDEEVGEARQEVLAEQKKKLIVINRELNYLQASALDYAKLHAYEKEMRVLYDMQIGFDPTRSAPTFVPKRTPVHRSRPRSCHTKGQPLKKDIKLQLPIDRSLFWFSSPYGPRRKKDGSWGFHHGIDLAALKGTPVYAAADGIVSEVSYQPKGYGKCIIITHGTKYKTRYAHLDQIMVRSGDRIAVGTMIGKVGNTGLVRGKNPNHLHFEVLEFGKRINPLYILGRL